VISEAEARELIRENVNPGPVETASLVEALDRTLAVDVIAPGDFPPFSYSSFDGYAVRVEDTLSAAATHPVELRIIGTAVAGQVPEVSVEKGRALRIMTGALMPAGADAVVKQEDIEADGETLRLRHSPEKGEGVRERGWEVKKGAVALSKGAMVGPEEIGFLSSLGVETVEVLARPRTVLIMIGDELVSPGKELSPGKIHTGNALMLHSLVLKYGGIPEDFGIVPDSEEEIGKAMRKAAKGDIIITTGGSGRGVHDLTSRAFVKSGGRFVFQGVAIWPGGTMSFGLMGNTPCFMLPGGPRTASICFHIFVRNALETAGATDRNFSFRISAVMLDRLRGRPGMTNYSPVGLNREGHESSAERVRTRRRPGRKSALAVLPPGRNRAEKGERVEVIII
jgi:molybdopterin molybdotransferase